MKKAIQISTNPVRTKQRAVRPQFSSSFSRVNQDSHVDRTLELLTKPMCVHRQLRRSGHARGRAGIQDLSKVASQTKSEPSGRGLQEPPKEKPISFREKTKRRIFDKQKVWNQLESVYRQVVISSFPKYVVMGIVTVFYRRKYFKMIEVDNFPV